MKIAIIIPSRLNAARLPRKPILPIQGTPMIARVLGQALKAQLGPVYVACDGDEIAAIVRNHGGTPLLTNPSLPSGTDRVNAGMEQLENSCDVVINLQGDLPFIDPLSIRKVIEPLQNSSFDIATLGAPIQDPKEWVLPQVVKAITKNASHNCFEAYDFQREDPVELRQTAFHHIGVYAFRKAVLQRFVGLSPSPREQDRKLEQMRALDDGMKIGLATVSQAPLAIDTPEDLAKAQSYTKSQF